MSIWRRLKRGPIWTVLIRVGHPLCRGCSKPEWLTRAELWCMGQTKAERDATMAEP